MDGSIATTYGVGTQVVVCDNTLSVALGSFASWLRELIAALGGRPPLS